MEEKQDTKATEKVEKKETKPVEKKGTQNKEIKKQEEPQDAKKKFEAPKVENKKIDNKSMIALAIIVVVIVIAVIMFIMTAGSPKKSVETMLKDLKSGKYSETVLVNTFAEDNFDEEAKTLLFDKLNCNKKIDSSLAIALDDKIIDTWIAHANYRMIDCSISIEDKVRKLIH